MQTYDYQAKKPVPMKDWQWAVMRRRGQEEEQEQLRSNQRREEVEALVKNLEQKSWAREGAKEDFGGTP